MARVAPSVRARPQAEPFHTNHPRRYPIRWARSLSMLRQNIQWGGRPAEGTPVERASRPPVWSPSALRRGWPSEAMAGGGANRTHTCMIRSRLYPGVAHAAGTRSLCVPAPPPAADAATPSSKRRGIRRARRPLHWLGGMSGADERILPIGGGFGAAQGIEAPLPRSQVNQHLDRLGEPDIVPALEHRRREPPG